MGGASALPHHGARAEKCRPLYRIHGNAREKCRPLYQRDLTTAEKTGGLYQRDAMRAQRISPLYRPCREVRPSVPQFLTPSTRPWYRGRHFSARTRKNGTGGSIPRRRTQRGGTGGVVSRHTIGEQVQRASFLGGGPGATVQGASFLGAAAGRARRTSGVTAWLEGARRGTRAARGCGRRGCRAASSQCWSGRGAPAPRAGRRPPQAGASRSCVARCGGAAP